MALFSSYSLCFSRFYFNYKLTVSMVFFKKAISASFVYKVDVRMDICLYKESKAYFSEPYLFPKSSWDALAWRLLLSEVNSIILASYEDVSSFIYCHLVFWRLLIDSWRLIISSLYFYPSRTVAVSFEISPFCKSIIFRSSSTYLYAHRLRVSS